MQKEVIVLGQGVSETRRLRERRLESLIRLSAFDDVFVGDALFFGVYDTEADCLYWCHKVLSSIVCEDVEAQPNMDDFRDVYVYAVEYEARTVKRIDPDMSLYVSPETVSEAVKSVYGNGGAIRSERQRCRCFVCGSAFTSDELGDEDFVFERDGAVTARCPYCGATAVLYEKSGFPVSADFVAKIRAMVL